MIAKTAMNNGYFVLLAVSVALCGSACSNETSEPGSGNGLNLGESTPAGDEQLAPESGDDASGDPTETGSAESDGNEQSPGAEPQDECASLGDGACAAAGADEPPVGDEPPASDETPSSDEPTVDQGCLEEHVAQCLENQAHECEGAEHPDACHEELRVHCQDEWQAECTTDAGAGDEPGSDEPIIDEGCLEEHVAQCLENQVHECEGAEHPDACHEELRAHCQDEWQAQCTVAEGDAPGDREACIGEHTDHCVAEAAGECEGAEHPDACHAELEQSCHAQAEVACS